jgi:hypothetical protein
MLETETGCEDERDVYRGQDKRPHIPAKNGCLFSKAWNPIPQCAPLSVNVLEGRKGAF